MLLESCSVKSIVLTGGTTAPAVYRHIAADPRFLNLDAVQYFLSDERCVPDNSKLSNYHVVKNALFPNGLPSNAEFNKMYIEELGILESANAYSRKLPAIIDLLILSVGIDGHIASIFPNDFYVFQSSELVAEVYGGNPFVSRLTITPLAIKRAKKICILALGANKADLYKMASQDAKSVSSMPVRLVFDSEWIVDNDLQSCARRLCDLICK